MALLIARGYVGGMDYEDMAFEVEELQQLTAKNFGYLMPTEEAESLIEATDGWIIGLLLSAQSKLRSISGRMRLMRASGLDLYDYLAEQVLNQQPDAIRDFLLRTSLLEEFDAALCATILGEEWRPEGYRWQELMAEVLRRNLFVLPLGDDSSWLRYNHVFQDFLQKRLMKVYPAEEQTILERLAAHYQATQEWEKAHFYLNRLGDLSAVADLVESAGLSLLYAGRITLLDSWLHELPSGFLTARAVLLAMHGDILIHQGKIPEGLATLTEAAELLDQEENLVHKAHTIVRRAVVQRRLGNYEAALDDTNRVIALLEGGAGDQTNLTRVYALALRSKGTVLCTVGDTEAGFPLLRQALTLYQQIQERYHVASLMQDTAVSYLQLGSYQDALGLFERALGVWQEAANLSGQSLVLNNIGYLYHLQGAYELALVHLEKALDCGRRSGNLRSVNYALISMGDLFTD
ncbi:MAG: tetratricopeptide repeat protein, partial [Caldilineaceae bacterium]|nr:tetratricopeptide repeat protein [Caldilineaceae bacterium]